MKKLWYGETVCDICHKEIKDILYDAPTVYGCWGILCKDCFNKVGRFGGQMYKKNKDKEFEKVK